MLRALARHLGDVRLVVPCPPGTDVEGARRAGLAIEAVDVSARSVASEARRAGAGLRRGEPYVFYHRHHSHGVRRALAAAVAAWRPDLLYLDHLDSFVYADVAAGRPFVLDLHNVYSQLTLRSAREHRHPLARWLLRSEGRRVARMEVRGVAQATLTLAVSEADAAAFSPHARRVAVVPNGVDCAAYSALPPGRPATDTPTLLYLGALNWPPNIAAARTLATTVLPAVRKHIPGARVELVGRGPTPEVLALARADNVSVHGDVPDVVPFLARASALVVPLESGGGTRLKIVESFAAGLPVVSTPVGCEGLEVRTDEHLLVATGDALAAAIVRLLTTQGLGHRLAAAGRGLAVERYDWDVVGRAAVRAIAGAVGWMQKEA